MLTISRSEERACASVLSKLQRFGPQTAAELLTKALLVDPGYGGDARPIDTLLSALDATVGSMVLAEARHFRATQKASHWYAPTAPIPGTGSVAEESEISEWEHVAKMTRVGIDWRDNTEQVLRGAVQESASLQQALIALAVRRAGRRQAFIALAGDDLAVEERLLTQLRERSRFRRPDRYAYTTLRARAVPTSDIADIVRASQKEPNYHVVRDQNIDADLRDRLPQGWPTRDALPLLYWNGTLHIGIPPRTESLAAVARIARNYAGPDCDVECHRLTEKSWMRLSRFFDQAGTHKVVRENLPPWRSPFVSDAEYAAVVRELAYLRECAALNVAAQRERGAAPV